MPQTLTDPIEALGFTRVVLNDEDGYGAGEICAVERHRDTTPSEPSSEAFAKLISNFVVEDLEGLQSHEAYARFIHIEEPPVAVLLRTAWSDGCRLSALICTQNHIHLLTFTNG